MSLPCTVAPDLFVGRDARRGHLVSLPTEALLVHMHVIGASGSGKSNYLTAIAMQLLLARQGATIIDPHPGSVIDTILAWVAEHRLDRSRSIRLIDPADPEAAFSFNPLAPRGFDPSVLVDLVVSATLQAWGQGTVTETPQITEVLTELYTALCVLELPLTDASDFLYRKDGAKARVRQWHLERLEELAPDTWAFWRDLESLRPDRQDEYLAPVRRRLSPFTRSPYIRRIFSQTNRCLDVAAEMDAGTMTLINLRPSPYLSGEVSRLLGALLTNEFYVTGFRRKNMSLQHYLIIDEFQRFLSPNVARALEESRKTGLSWVLAHQHLGHLRAEGEHLFRSVMTNTRTKVVFGGLEVEGQRVHGADALAGFIPAPAGNAPALPRRRGRQRAHGAAADEPDRGGQQLDRLDVGAGHRDRHEQGDHARGFHLAGAFDHGIGKSKQQFIQQLFARSKRHGIELAHRWGDDRLARR